MECLPDDLLVQILSLLPTKEAVSTSLLSKRWRTLFSLSHNLDFDDPISWRRPEDIRKSFNDFVDSSLAFQDGKHIKKFSLKYTERTVVEHEVDRWICKALEHGVSELHLHIKSTSWHSFPSQVFTSTTLVKLSLGTNQYFNEFSADTSLPALKVLLLDSIWFTDNQLLDENIHCVFQVISICCKGELPVFNNLVDLVFSGTKRGWKLLLPLLLERSPNLKNLFLSSLFSMLQGLDGFTCRRHRFTRIPPNNQIKMLSIMKFQGYPSEMKHIRYFLLKMECLEVVKVYIAAEMDDLKKMQLIEDLLKLPAASSKLKIQVK
ncbi:unnamed protein product [Arabidopsis halleri]